MKSSKHENRLAREKSPYLLQHARNPVDWYPWGKDAFEKAKKENKPIFLSIGYSTCHRCHVMERESFEHEGIAELLNRHYVPIKVDREERPDIDQIYMAAIQALTGSGGWPLSVFLTPDGKPFTGGTYFPPEDSGGRAGMKTLLPRIAALWKEKRAEVESAGAQIVDLLKSHTTSAGALAPMGESGAVQDILNPDGRPHSPLMGECGRAGTKDSPVPAENLLTKAFQQFEAHFDSEHGGFGRAPKFPRSHELSFLLRHWKRTGDPAALEMTAATLDFMARGGIYDHLGGGFHRYSTDERLLVPHFEKMLYDQALLAVTYLEAYAAAKKNFYAETAEDVFRYVLRDMTHPEGGFYSAEDADSEGEEGKFYVWHPEEILRILGEETGRLFNEIYGVAAEGNFESGTSILHLRRPPEYYAEEKKMEAGRLKTILKEAREKLFAARKKRVPPSKDDKILVSWNGLMISALARGAQVLNRAAYAEAAGRAAEFILGKMQADGRLLHRFRDGEAAIPAFQDDYAFFAAGLLDLYEATLEVRWLEEALRLARQMVELFWDEAGGGFFYRAADAEELITRSKEYYDGAVPSGNSAAALLLLKLSRITADTSLGERAERTLSSNLENLEEYPMGFPQMLTALDFALGPSGEIVLAGRKEAPDFQAMLRLIHGMFLPRHVVIHHPEGAEAGRIEALARDIAPQKMIEGRAAAYVCENYRCKAPVSHRQELEKILSGTGK